MRRLTGGMFTTGFLGDRRAREQPILAQPESNAAVAREAAAHFENQLASTPPAPLIKPGIAAGAVSVAESASAGVLHGLRVSIKKIPTGYQAVTAGMKPTKRYVQWLTDRSMLQQAQTLVAENATSKGQWAHGFALPKSSELASKASVWYAAYPTSAVTPQGVSFLADQAQQMGELQKLGVQNVHLGPVQTSGGLRGRQETPTIDGYFDRTGMDVAGQLGTTPEFQHLTATAREHGAMVFGDLVPGHTGKGPDWKLATMGHPAYQGLYLMECIEPQDYGLLPRVPKGQDSVNLSREQLMKLVANGYSPGTLENVIYEGQEGKRSNYSVTAPIRGVDGKTRRWLYMHRFYDGQPSLNWADPSMGAQRLVIGDGLNSIKRLGAGGVRLDYTGGLGVESVPGSETGWSEGHPTARVATEQMAMQIRKMGGFTFAEDDSALDKLGAAKSGPDFSYDFYTRAGMLHALATGDASFLRMSLEQQEEYNVDPGSMIHALQNHDEMNINLAHLAAHGDEKFDFRGQAMTGKALRTLINQEVRQKIVKETDYNKDIDIGITTTFAGFSAAALGIKDPYHMTAEQTEDVKKLHLLAAAYCAMQPGVFAVSGWDVVGALPLKPEQVPELVKGGDYRWLNRPAYDLMGTNPQATQSDAGIPVAKTIYGPLPTQLEDPHSFASQLQHMNEVREQYQIPLSKEIDLPDVHAKGLAVRAFRLPDGGLALTALNFGREPLTDTVRIKIPADMGLGGKQMIGKEILSGTDRDAAMSGDGYVTLKLDALQAKTLVFGAPSATTQASVSDAGQGALEATAA